MENVNVEPEVIEEVIAEESQMLYLLANISQMEVDEIGKLKTQMFGDEDEMFTI